jgi:hypothetical protein
VAAFFSGHEIDEFTPRAGPVMQSLPDFRVGRVKPRKRSERWVYVSIGASDAMAGEHIRLEFLLLSKKETPLHFHTLAAIAYYQQTYRKGLGDVLVLGRPWLEGSRCDRFLITLPYPFGPKLEWCDVGEDHVRFLWLVPITASEHQFIQEHDVEAFEDKLEKSFVDPIDVKRRSIV